MSSTEEKTETTEKTEKTEKTEEPEETEETETTKTTSTATNTEETKTVKTVRRKNWLPLESNPSLMSKYIKKLGVDEKHVFHEIYGVDEGLLMMVPQPVHALLMAFPISKASEKHKEEEKKEIESNGQEVDDKVWFIKQIIGNACGTIGLLHAVLNANIDGRLDLVEDKFFHKFKVETEKMNSMERAKALEANEDIEEEHKVLADSGTSNVSHSVNMNMHFNAFTIVDGTLYEFDGRKAFPINHGKCSADELLTKGIGVIKEFMARDPKDIRFNLVALGDVQD